MKISINILGWIVAATLGAIMFFIQTCEKPCPEPQECPSFDTTAFIKTLPVKYKDTIIYKPYQVIIYKDTGSTKYIEVPVGIDSLEIAKAYFSWRVSKDTILNDTNGLIVVTDTITQNEIYNRTIFPKTIFPQYKLVTTTIIKKEELKNIFLLGGGVTGNAQSVGFSVGAGLLNKKRQILLGSYDLLRKEIQIQYYIPIRFKKR